MRQTQPFPAGRTAVLIDGEHYPAVVLNSLRELEKMGAVISSLGFLGGTEKISDPSNLSELYGPNVVVLDRPENRRGSSKHANTHALLLAEYEKWLRALKVGSVVDLSDEPVVDLSLRIALIEITRELGIEYRLPDAAFFPQGKLATSKKPVLMVIGTGKRVGKTGVTGNITRGLIRKGVRPVIIATGRGGPGRPVVVLAQDKLTGKDLLERSDLGMHAASDYFEDAFFTGATTIGSRRCGGGLFGVPHSANMHAALKIADKLPEELVILEGSGASVPQGASDKRILVIGAFQSISEIDNDFMRSRVLRADAVVITMCEKPFANQKKLKDIQKVVRSINDNCELKFTVFRPKPSGQVNGRTAFLATTAKKGANKHIVAHLAEKFGCKVQHISNNLSDRSKLSQDLDRYCVHADIILCEIKAAGIDIVTEYGKKIDKPVVYVDNVPMDIETGRPLRLLAPDQLAAKVKSDRSVAPMP